MSQNNGKFYDVDACLRKSDQHSEMGSLAACDGDRQDAKRHFDLSKVWMDRAREGGWQEGS